MKNTLAVFATLVTVAAHCEEPRFPYLGTLLYPKSGDVRNSLFHIECSAPDRPTLIDCHTTQIMFTKKDSSSNIEELMSSAELEEMLGGDDKKKQCGDIKSNQHKISELSKEVQQIFAHWMEFCDSSSRNDMKNHLRKAFELSLQREAKSCKPMLLTDRYSFEWQAQSGKWRSVSQPDDECGSVVVMTLSSEKGWLWEFHQTTVFTNTDGETLIGSCEERAEARKEPMSWSWDGQPIERNCQIIGNP